MALKTASGTAECPECFAEIELTNVMQNEIAQCPDCGADLEVVNIEPIDAGAGAPRRRGLGRVTMKVGILYRRVRVEEKLLFEEFEKRGGRSGAARRRPADLRDHAGAALQQPVHRLRRRGRALHQPQPRALQPADPQRPGVKTVNTALRRRHLRQQAADDQRARRAPVCRSRAAWWPTRRRARSRRSRSSAIRSCSSRPSARGAAC